MDDKQIRERFDLIYTLLGIIIGVLIFLVFLKPVLAQIPTHNPPPVWSQMQPNLHLPPVEFDKPYPGKLTVETVSNEQLRARCASASQSSLGCAFPGKDSCLILLVDDAAMKAGGWTRDLMYRHERAHCNGWPQSHAGKRPL